MKKIFLIFFSVLILFSAMTSFGACDVATSVDATSFLAGCGDPTIGVKPGGSSTDQSTLYSEIRDRIETIAKAAISFGALLAVGAIVWSGIQYTKSYGDDEKLKKAKSTSIFALIGLVLLMGSFGLIDIFINFVYTIAGV